MNLDFEVQAISRLDKALRDKASLAVQAAKRLIQEGSIKVNGHVVKKPAFQLRPGDRIQCEPVPGTERKSNKVRTGTKPAPRKSTLNILFEDEYLIAVDKPAGFLSVPTSFSDEQSVEDWVSDYLTDKKSHSRAHAAHRIDRMASGVLVFAKDPQTCELLMEQFKKKRVRKTYLCLTEALDEDMAREGVISLPIDDSQKKSRVEIGHGKPAETEYAVIDENDQAALVRAIARTGRRHQVRAHLSAALSPIQGDRFYGHSTDEKARLMLHCESIEFAHPHGGEKLHIRATTPPGFSV